MHEIHKFESLINSIDSMDLNSPRVSIEEIFLSISNILNEMQGKISTLQGVIRKQLEIIQNW